MQICSTNENKYTYRYIYVCKEKDYVHVITLKNATFN